jgi:hypothetical protein
MKDPVQAGEEVEQVLDIVRVEFSEKVSGILISSFPSEKVREPASTSGSHNNSTAVARIERTGRI